MLTKPWIVLNILRKSFLLLPPITTPLLQTRWAITRQSSTEFILCWRGLQTSAHHHKRFYSNSRLKPFTSIWIVSGAFVAGLCLGAWAGYSYSLKNTPVAPTIARLSLSHQNAVEPETELDLYSISNTSTEPLSSSWTLPFIKTMPRLLTPSQVNAYNTSSIHEPVHSDQVLQPNHNPQPHSRKSSTSGGAFIADAVEKVIESVVNLSVETEVTSFFGNKTLVSSGSGFFVTTDGKILTNAHVVADMNEDSKLWVTAADGLRYPAKVHSLDTLSDLAIVRIQPRSSPHKWQPVQFGTNHHLRPGDWVIAIGSPFGLQNTVTAGVVSSRSRRSIEIGTKDTRVEYIQTDCVVHSGSSGGPLVNLDGQVVGINTTRAESEGISFAIRVDNAMDMIHQLVVDGRVTRPWLGIRMITLTPHVRSQLNPDSHYTSSFQNTPNMILPHVTSGVLVASVEAKSPASDGGLKDGDVIVAVDGVGIRSSQELLKLVGLRVGEPFAMRIKRCVPNHLDEITEEERVVNVTPGALDMFVHSNGGSEIL
ncbi:hypothetical protein BDEG_21998 [Batrachochytrium dendrobatidis JEL423]|nr:hypothetical protein BDEG_21998 [Batrachochytrium dendrobatidis JEL423]